MTEAGTAWTPGPVHASNQGDSFHLVQDGGGWFLEISAGYPLNKFPNPGDVASQLEADVRLIAEAFNVATETGLTPRQLAEAVERLSAALKSQTGRTWEEIERADKADHMRVAIETGKVHPALSIDVQEHRQQAYQTGWNDGYAEGFGKAAQDRTQLAERAAQRDELLAAHAECATAAAYYIDRLEAVQMRRVVRDMAEAMEHYKSVRAQLLVAEARATGRG